jgi:hypothetical protein
LLAGLTGKAQVGFNHEVEVGRLQSVCQGLPIVLLQNQTKVRHGHHVVADTAREGCFERFSQVKGNLVREKIKVHPSVGGATLLAAKEAAIKTASLVEVRDMKSKMKKAVHASKHISQLGAGAAGRTRMHPPD